MTKSKLSKTLKDTTLASHVGRQPDDHQGLVNVPVHRASSILFPTLAELHAATMDPARSAYGRTGTASTFALQDAIAALEGSGGATVLTPSGSSAISTVLLTFA